MRSLNNMVW